MQNEKHSSDDFFNKLRKEEYARLGNHVYLDYTGGNLHPKSLVDAHQFYLQNAVYGNPHSSNPASQLSEKFVTEARAAVLRFFSASDYYCVFTNNASGALQIIGECYPFCAGSHFLLTADNHNSVNGIREICVSKGGSYTYSAIESEDLTINEMELNNHLRQYPGKQNKLFAYPAQSNASGVQHALRWVATAQQYGWDVLLDAAAFAPGSELDLSVIQPEFVCVSFYKIFGYPTGVGCLLIKKTAFAKLRKTGFAGGTLSLSSIKGNGYFFKQNYEKFESGTVNYLNIPALTNGLNFITTIGMGNINTRIKELSHFLLVRLKGLHHENGKPLIKLYGPEKFENRGGTFLLNFYDRDGQLYPFEDIEELANAEQISLRTGCFCNPGVDEVIHSLCADDLKNYFNSREQGDYNDMMNFLGRGRGAVRVSVGIPTTKSDLLIFLSFAKTFLNRNIATGSSTTLRNAALMGETLMSSSGA